MAGGNGIFEASFDDAALAPPRLASDGAADDAPARDADVSAAEEDCFAPENSREDDAEKFAEHQRKFAAADDDITDEEFNALFGT